MSRLITEDVQFTLITAPETVRETYLASDHFLTMHLVMHPGFVPSAAAISEAFWRRFVEAGGTDDDFAWMLERELCDEAERPVLDRMRVEVAS